MAQESPIAKLAAKPLQFQVAVLIGTLVVLGLLYYQFFYSTLDEDLQSSKSAYAREEKKNDELTDKKAEWAQMVKDKEVLDIQLSTNQVSLPETADLASFIGHMQRQAAVAGVSFRNWSRQKEEVLPGYVKVPISIEVVGSFHQVLKYFYLLGKTKRIITVEDFALVQDKGTDAAEVLLKATFRASTFRQPDGAAGVTQAAEVIPPPPPPTETGANNEPPKKDGQGNPIPEAKSGTDRLKSSGAN